MVAVVEPQVMVRVPLPLSATVHEVPFAPFAPFAPLLPLLPFAPLAPLAPSFTVAVVPSVQVMVVVPSPLLCAVHAEPSAPLAPSEPLGRVAPLPQATTAAIHRRKVR